MKGLKGERMKEKKGSNEERMKGLKGERMKEIKDQMKKG